jgi:hypothetical protein
MTRTTAAMGEGRNTPERGSGAVWSLNLTLGGGKGGRFIDTGRCRIPRAGRVGEEAARSARERLAGSSDSGQ